ncbi:MAG: hypothetical protein JO004_03440 [Methylobacteriaceae bacterium]|nr:hypothetical protein [Methylobacteriaceae bacterium]
MAEELSEKDLIAQHVAKVIVRRARIEVEMQREPDEEEEGSTSKLVIRFSPTVMAQKGITREPAIKGYIDALTREKLLHAIRRATRWIEALRSGEAKSFAEIGSQEGLGERHVRRLAQLAFLSPKVAAAILYESGPAGRTISSLCEALPHRWAAQKEIL